MSSLTTTHRHNYRWPKADCLIPQAEAPNGHCEVRIRQQGGQPEQRWCGQDAPTPQPAARSHSVVCCEVVPTPVERPWCRRSLLALTNSPQNEPISELQMRLEQSEPKSPTQSRRTMDGSLTKLQHHQTSKPWCSCNHKSNNREESEPKRHLQPKGCHEPAKPNLSIGDCAQGMVAARVGVAPQQHASRYNQPDQYLQKLCVKHSRPMAVVAATPQDELIRRVYADRYRTTYQSDFCKNADDTPRLLGKCDTYDPDFKQPTFHNLERPVEFQHNAGFVTCNCGCGCQMALHGLPPTYASAGDTPKIRPIACRPAIVSDNVHFSCCTPKKNIGVGSQKEEVGPPQKIPPWASEYTDGIGRTGQMIFEQKILHPKKK